MNEYEFPEKKISNVQSQLERLIEKNYYLNKSAKDAFRSYLQAYASHSMKDVFNVHSLDLNATAKSFCFSNPPRVNINLMGSGKGEKVKRRGGGGGFGDGYVMIINRNNPRTVFVGVESFSKVESFLINTTSKSLGPQVQTEEQIEGDCEEGAGIWTQLLCVEPVRQTIFRRCPTNSTLAVGIYSLCPLPQYCNIITRS